MLTLLLALAVASEPAPAEPPRDKLRFGLDWRLWGRNLKFEGASAPAGLSIGALPTGVTFDIQWFPMAYFLDDIRADVGLTVRADIAPEQTLVAGETTFRASTARLRTGMMLRIPFHHVEPSVHVGFHAFEASTTPQGITGPRRPMPNVSLTGPRLGLGLRVLEFWRVTFDIAVGATWIITTGELGSAAYFPGARGNAFDGSLGLAFRTWPFLDIRIGVDVTVHSLALRAGVSVTDAYYGISFGFIFKGVHLPGG